MAEQDALAAFDFSKMSKPGKFIKFEAGRALTIRILTKDPIVQEKEYRNEGEEPTTNVKLCFIVYNFTDNKAQVLGATPGMSKTFQRIAKDEDFGANLQQCDIKITPDGEKLKRTYDISVVRHSGNQKQLTAEQIKEAQAINLDEDIEDSRGRLSTWEQPSTKQSGYETAKAAAASLGYTPDEIAEVNDTPINLDEIPF